MRVVLQPKQRQHLTKIAAQRGMTTEELARQIICRYLEGDKASLVKRAVPDRGGLGTEIASLFPKHGLDFSIPELRFTIQNPFESPKRAAQLRAADGRGRLSPHKPSPKSSSSRRKKRA